MDFQNKVSLKESFYFSLLDSISLLSKGSYLSSKFLVELDYMKVVSVSGFEFQPLRCIDEILIFSCSYQFRTQYREDISILSVFFH